MRQSGRPGSRVAGASLAAVLTVVVAAVAGAMLLSLPRAALAGGSNELCLGCHGQRGLTTTFEGGGVDLYVDPDRYASSPHGQEACTSCHPQFQGFDHGRVALGEELRTLSLQTCVTCHQGYDFGGGVSSHPDPLTCAKCHGPIHEVVPASQSDSPINRSNAVDFCGSCHEKEEEAYYYSFHGSAYRLGSGQAPLCTDCHGHLSPVEGNVTKGALVCGSCHSGSAAAMANLLQGREHVTPQDREKGFPLWAVWKFFLVVILLNTAKDGSLAILDLTRRLRARRNGHVENDGRGKEGRRHV